ncbi:hypothetical protein TESG_03599 [Trichophyton tonsurans CBS 112818]|uniref:Uncharacterized protein n=1 Tax=Trichophyton tonsurans (strain CBS 112818) TaxID=647933 RepID=F2RXU6_TRIT1|nr:hypothetical protein TESG_03599 [Trichophyton tonsurans CBS 112818]
MQQTGGIWDRQYCNQVFERGLPSRSVWFTSAILQLHRKYIRSVQARVLWRQFPSGFDLPSRSCIAFSEGFSLAYFPAADHADEVVFKCSCNSCIMQLHINRKDTRINQLELVDEDPFEVTLYGATNRRNWRRVRAENVNKKRGSTGILLSRPPNISSSPPPFLHI